MTGLRFFLAAWVILHHLTGKGMMLEFWAAGLPGWTFGLVRGGYLAVQTFFILSGFVLARSCARVRWDRAGLKKFGIARIARIYPVYLLSIAIMVPFIFDAMLRPDRSGLQKAWLLTSYTFILQGWTPSLGVGWNTPAWSLSCEFFFYLCFPLLFLWLRNAKPLRASFALALALVVPIALAHAHVAAYLKPLHHLSDFTAGIAAAAIFARLETRKRRWASWMALAAVICGSALIVHPEVLHGTLADLNTGLRPLNVALLLGLGLNRGWAAKAFGSRAIEYLGKVSYSMYILHVPVLWWVNRYATDRLRYGHSPDGVFLYVVIVLVVSVAAFEYVEIPANLWLRGRKVQPISGVLRTPQAA